MTKSPTEKNCKIIVTYYGNRPPKIKDPTEIMTILDEVMDNDISIDKGLPCDTIIVNNSTDNKEFVSFLKKYNNKKTKNGIIKVIKGNNIGVSFGGYNLAFQKLKYKYQNYWMFAEDDFTWTFENYFKDGVDIFNSKKEIGFVCMVGLTSRGRLQPGGDIVDVPRHCDGGMGITHYDCLTEVCDINGELPYYSPPEVNTKVLPYYKHQPDIVDKTNQVIKGEIPFTNIYHSSLSMDIVSITDKLLNNRVQLKKGTISGLGYIGLYK